MVNRFMLWYGVRCVMPTSICVSREQTFPSAENPAWVTAPGVAFEGRQILPGVSPGGGHCFCDGSFHPHPLQEDVARADAARTIAQLCDETRTIER